MNLLVTGTNKLSVSSEQVDFFELSSDTVNCNLASTRCFVLTDTDVCEVQYLWWRNSGGSLEANGSVPITAIQTGAHPSCKAGKALTAGNVGLLEVTLTVEFGNVWFFAREDHSVWPPPPGAPPGTSSGRESKILKLKKPLPYFRGGLIRYYASSTLLRGDSLKVCASG